LKFLIKSPDVRVVLLPRNKSQAKILRQTWAEWIASRKIVIPEHVMDGLNLIWVSDLVISGGGTMNREAAALGVPVYSIFRGKIGAVDRHLQMDGRLILIESEEDISRKIILKRRQKNKPQLFDQRPALQAILGGIAEITAAHAA
jgi:predicted glycosyltransferase